MSICSNKTKSATLTDSFKICFVPTFGFKCDVILSVTDERRLYELDDLTLGDLDILTLKTIDREKK